MDLNFRIARIPVHVAPTFFLTALFLGGLGGDLGRAVVWVAVVFASVLAHELGHAAAGSLFGLRPTIDLHAMGGTTSWSGASGASGARRPSIARRVLISVAGPGAGFALAVVVLCVRRAVESGGALDTGLGGYAVRSLLWVNVGWGILNLLPILPLDGGHVIQLLLDGATGGRGERPARIVSLVAAALAALLAFTTRNLYPALLAVTFVAIHWQALGARESRER
jgi:Zn-dependent protease